MSDTFLNPIEIAEVGATPTTPSAGYKKIYAKADGNVYALDATGAEVKLTPALTVSAGTNTTAVGTVNFSNANGVTFGMNTNGVVTAVGGGAFSAGTQIATAGTVVFSNSNNVTFGMSNNTVTASVAAGLTTAAQSDHSHGVTLNLTNLSGTTGGNSNGIILSLSANSQTVDTNKAGTGFTSTSTGGTNIVGTLGTNGLSIAIPNYITTTPAQSADTNKAGTGFTSAGANIGLSGTLGTNGLNLSATVPAQTQFVLSNSNGVSFGTNGSTVTATVRTDYASSNHTHGNVAFSGTNVSASFTSASNGLSIQLSAANGGGGADGGVGISAGTTSVSNGTVNFANANGVSFGLNGSTLTASHNGITQQTTQAQSVTLAGNTAGQSTVTANQLTIAGGNNITLVGGAGVYTISGANQSADTNKAGTGFTSAGAGIGLSGTLGTNGLNLSATVRTDYASSNHTHGNVAFSGTNVSASFTSASNGLSIQLSSPNPSAGGGGVAIAGGTNTQTSGTVNFSNSNGVSFGLNTNGVMTAAGGGAIAAGSQIATQGTVSFVNSNGVSFGMSGSSQITAQIAPHTYTLIGNTVGDSTVSGANFVFSGGNNITLSGTSNTIVISAAAGGGGVVPNRSYIEINQGERLSTIRVFSEQVLSNRPFFFPFWMDGTGVRANTVRFFVSGGASSNRSLGVTLNCGIYSQVNTSQMSLLTSGSIAYSITASSASSVWNGIGVLDITGMSNFTATAEGRYMLALQVNPVSTNTVWANMSIYGCDNYPNFAKIFSGNTTAATNATQQLLPWQGAYSTTSAGLPSTVGKTQIQGGNSASAYQPYAVIMGI